jgi:hypothetical protein
VYVALDEDVEPFFPSGKEVNDALRAFIAEGRVPAPRDE